MKSVTINEHRDGEITMQFGNNTAEVNEAIRSLTIRLEGCTMNILEHGELIEAKALARKILNEY